MRWISFAQSDSLSRSIVHLFPTSKGGFSAQPLHCTVELFADRPESTAVALDGMQLNQPDGVRLEELFPRLKEGGNSLVGVSVTLETTSGRGDLSPSTCAIEIVNRSGSVHFAMKRDEANNNCKGPIAVITDRTSMTSLALINQSTRYVELELRNVNLGANGATNGARSLHSLSVAPSSVNEYSLSGQSGLAGEPFSTTHGDVLVEGQELLGDLSEGVVAFVLYRDSVTKAISSVVSV